MAEDGDAELLCGAVPVDSGIFELPVPPCDDPSELELELTAVPVGNDPLVLPVP